MRSSSAENLSGAANTTPSSSVMLNDAKRASSPLVSTTTRSLLANKVVVSAATRLRSAAMSPSSLSYSNGGGLATPLGNSSGLGVSGDGLVSGFCCIASLGGGAPRSSEPVLVVATSPPPTGLSALSGAGFAASGLASSFGAGAFLPGCAGAALTSDAP